MQLHIQNAGQNVPFQITKRKQAETIFLPAQKFAEDIVDTIRESLIVLTPDLKIISANSSFYKFFQVAPEETEGLFLFAIGNHQWDIPKLREQLKKIVPQNRHVNDFEVQHTFPCIGQKTMLLNARRISREGGSKKMILLALEDITIRRQREEALIHSEKRYRRLFETAQDGILIIDAKTGHIVDVNPFLLEMLGYTSEAVLGKKLWEIGLFKDINASKAAFSDLLSCGYVRYNDLPLETKDGRSIDVEFVSNVYFVDHHKIIQCNIRDITERKHLAETLQKAHNDLERKVEERTVNLQAALSEIKTLKERLEAENIYLRKESELKNRFENILGQSAGLKYVLYRAELVAPGDTTVLILGETGTGKGLIASAIHEMSPRKERPMVTINCAALPANLIESELFGREKGAYTGAHSKQLGRFEVAHGSTICLDEIGELSLELQAKLLRVIQYGEFERLGSSHTIKVDVRIIATTNRDLQEEICKDRFRQDLYYRLNVFPITVPPIRQRKEDIPLLVKSFIDRYSRKLGKQITSIQEETLQVLRDYPWPGNIRELESIIERAVIMCPGPVFQLTDHLEISTPLLSPTAKTLEETERNQILKILLESQWRIEGKEGAAVILGIHPSTLRARMHKLGIVRPKATDSTEQEYQY